MTRLGAATGVSVRTRAGPAKRATLLAHRPKTFLPVYIVAGFWHPSEPIDMTRSFLSAWVIFPAAMLVLSAGAGLLVRRVGGGRLPAVLVLPVGFALSVVICAFACSYSWSAPLAGPLVAAVALIGLVLEARGRPWHGRKLRPGPWLWPLLAALAAFAAVGGPVFLTGEVGWTGYTRIVDIAFQFDFSQHLAEAGRVSNQSASSSYNVVVTKLINIGYPGGAQATLGSIATLIGANVAWCYQAFLAFTAAMGALAIFSLLGRLTRNGLMRFVGATVAIQPNILYGYTLEAGIKELTTAALLLVVVALFADRLPGDGPRRGVLPAAVAVSAAFAAFSLGIAPWLGLILLGMLIVSLAGRARPRRLALESWGVFAAAAIVISLPGLVTAAKLATIAGTAVGGVVDLGLGNLAAPVSRWASAGVWLTGDYRFPLTHAGTSHVFDVMIIVFACVGVVGAVLRRRWAIVVLGATAPIALYYFLQHSTAWIQLKAFTITASFALTLAFAGAAALQASARRWLKGFGWLAALVMGAAVLYGNAIIYHDTTLAPGARYEDLASIAKRYSGQGPALYPYFDEYAEYFLRSEHGTSLVDPANFTFQVRPTVPQPAGVQSFGWDLNQLVPSYLQSFPLIILPRSPAATRPPSNYDLVEQTPYFEVWRQDRPAATVVAHLPLSSLPHERTPKLCKDLVLKVRKAGPGAQVAYARSSTASVLNPAQAAHPDYWAAIGPGTLDATGAGSVKTTLTLPAAGRYSIWLEGSLGRPLTVYVDGRRLSSVGYEDRYPDQFLLLAHAQLAAGTHTLRLVRGNGTLHPGSGDPSPELDSRTIGAIVFNSEDSSTNRVYVAPASRAAQVCAAPVGYEWLEVLKPGGAPADAVPAEG